MTEATAAEVVLYTLGAFHGIRLTVRLLLFLSSIVREDVQRIVAEVKREAQAWRRFTVVGKR